MYRRQLSWFVLIFGGLGLVPLVLQDTFWLRVITEGIMWIGLAITWDVIGGYTGYVSFGHGAFFGVGAYTTAVLMLRSGWPFALALPVGGILAGVLALLAGLPTLRLKGAYFAIATWALSRAIQQLALVMPITGGTNGLRFPPFLNPQFFFYVMLGIVAATFLLLWILLEHSSFGLKLKAIREDEAASMAVGLKPTLIKVQSFMLSAVPAGVLGGVYAYWISYIDPGSVLSDLVTDQAVVMAVFGGLGTLVGPAIGAVVLFAFKMFFWAKLSNFEVLYLIVLGALIALSVVFLPDGLWGALTARRGARKARSLHTEAPVAAAKEETGHE
jgi:branched-chain amino acid transport system permease protein